MEGNIVVILYFSEFPVWGGLTGPLVENRVPTHGKGNFFSIPEVKQEYKEWIGKVDLPEAYEKKACRIKDTAQRGSSKGPGDFRRRTSFCQDQILPPTPNPRIPW